MAPITELRRAAATDPASAPALLALGQALLDRCEEDEALRWLHAATAADPSLVEPRLQAAAVLRRRGHREQAIEYLECAVRVAAPNPNVKRALAWIHLEQPEGVGTARILFEEALSAGRDFHAVVGLCRTYIAEGHPIERTLAAVGAMTQGPGGRLEVRLAMSHALGGCGRYDDAWSCLEGTGPDHSAPRGLLLRRARLHTVRGQLEEARALYERAWHSYPSAQTATEYSQCLFRTGAFRDAQLLCRQERALRFLHPPGRPSLWTGAAVDGQTVLFRRVGKFGDMIGFSRLAGRLGRRGAQVVLETVRPLRELLECIPGVIGAVLPHDDVAYDVECHPLSALMLLDWEWPMTSDIPYLQAPRGAVEPWNDDLANERGLLHVGVAWRGSGDYPGDHYTCRSMPAECLRPLLDVPNVRFHSLCAGREAETELGGIHPPLPIRPLSRTLTTFSDTAAVLTAMDLVVSVDTSTAHLAGALGRPSLLMLPYACDWAWMAGDGDCGWYTHARIFRQPTPGDWQAVVAAVQQEVERRAAHRPGAQVTPVRPMLMPGNRDSAAGSGARRSAS